MAVGLLATPAGIPDTYRLPTPLARAPWPPGTPLQNNLSELWSLLNFLLPEVFSSLAEFEGWFDFSGSAAGEGAEEDPAVTQRHQVIAKLHDLLRPFLLRRLKADVEIALPRKQEVVLYAPMSPLQKTLNQQLLDKSLRVRWARVGAVGRCQVLLAGGDFHACKV